jgi:hypothetical protein
MPTTSLGAHIDFSAAVWSTRPNVQVLSTALPHFFRRETRHSHLRPPAQFEPLLVLRTSILVRIP